MSKTSYEDYLGDRTKLKAIAEKVKERLRTSKYNCNILIAGATGVGKSSLINVRGAKK